MSYVLICTNDIEGTQKTLTSLNYEPKLAALHPDTTCAGILSVRMDEAELEALTAVVGGPIEVIDRFPNDTIGFCNEVGKILGLSACLYQPSHMQGYDLVCGAWVVCEDDGKGNSVGLPMHVLHDVVNNMITTLRLEDGDPNASLYARAAPV